jgi:hypothetical protein
MQQELADELARHLADKGLMVEGGWQMMKALVMPKNAPVQQIHDCRIFFFAGAQHVWSSLLSIMEKGTDATEADLRRMENIEQEMGRFVTEFNALMAARGIYPDADSK